MNLMVGRLVEFNVGLEQRSGLRHIHKDDPETCHRSYDPPRRIWLPRFLNLVTLDLFNKCNKSFMI